MLSSSVDSFSKPRFHLLCSICYSLIRVRGKKNASMYFSHDLPLFFPLSTAVQHSAGLSVPWKTRCVLLYWLSVVLLNPYQFDDSTLPALTSLPSAVHPWILHDDPLGEMCAHFLAVLFSRRFFPDSLLPPTFQTLVDDALASLHAGDEQPLLPLLRMLAAFAKLAPTPRFLATLPAISPLTQESPRSAHATDLLMKLLYRCARHCLRLVYKTAGIDPLWVFRCTCE